MGKTKLKLVSYYIEPEQFEELKALSEETGASVSELLRRAVTLYLGQQKND